MAAGAIAQPPNVTPPRVTVLQLDTQFLRIAGDVASPETYATPPQILRIPAANVSGIVTDDPSTVRIDPFLDALDQVTGDIVVTSCGFLAPFQDTLAARCDRPVIASGLQALAHVAHLDPDDVAILTFDAAKLGPRHLGPYQTYTESLRGLDPQGHLARVIAGDGADLDRDEAAQDVLAALGPDPVQAIVIECTNIPPYKSQIRRRFPVPIHDILTEIERRHPGAIRPQHL